MLNIILTILVIFSGVSCASFIEETEIGQIKQYEKKTYIMKKDVVAGSYNLKQKQQVKIFIKTEDESLKVYGYPAETSFLKSDRVLVLYLFEDDFKEARFDRVVFEKRLFEIIKPKN